MHIAFIGGGNMAAALIGGLLDAGHPAAHVRVADPSEAARSALAEAHGVRTADRAASVVDGADVVVLAVKPQVMPGVLDELQGKVGADQLLVSIAAGIPIRTLQRTFGDSQPVVRAMPNTPALVGAGITGLCASDACSRRHRDQAEHVLGAAGEVVWVDDEALMDVVTAVSGSGPAYFFLLIEALHEAGVAEGLPAQASTRLAAQTALGAGTMAARAAEDVAELRRRVTSPGGTTQAALETFEAGGFRALVADAVHAAVVRGRELGGGDGDD